MIKNSNLVWEAHIFQCVVHEENCAPGHVLKVHFECFQNHLHRVEWILRIDKLSHVEIYLIKFLNVKLLNAAS